MMIRFPAITCSFLFIMERKNIVSMRIANDDRLSVQSLASRLFIRESDIYRLAINQLLVRFDKLLDSSCKGKDLLPLFLELREELNLNVGFKKNQLYNILNCKETSPTNYVSMADIELLLLPQHAIRQRLSRMTESLSFKTSNTELWLKNYLLNKYAEDNASAIKAADG